MAILSRSKINPGQPWWTLNRTKPVPKKIDGWRFSLKGSPRHYEDVLRIIESDPKATVYFGEALTYERGAGVALWRINAESFEWLPKLYNWWAETERIEPVVSTFYLYLPSNNKYPAFDLRSSTPVEVERYIRTYAPQSEAEAQAQSRRI
ncbi:MAG: hypothetical protein KC438_05460 [Thermomicrobiales bacterium]|nr:hypothetical protein [Thermomicrobiales bacterium]MCO5220418.1 hypothetical protein [Thermomicrobiales bacterium]